MDHNPKAPKTEMAARAVQSPAVVGSADALPPKLQEKKPNSGMTLDLAKPTGFRRMAAARAQVEATSSTKTSITLSPAISSATSALASLPAFPSVAPSTRGPASLSASPAAISSAGSLLELSAGPSDTSTPATSLSLNPTIVNKPSDLPRHWFFDCSKGAPLESHGRTKSGEVEEWSHGPRPMNGLFSPNPDFLYGMSYVQPDEKSFLFSLPEEVIGKIISYLTDDRIAIRELSATSQAAWNLVRGHITVWDATRGDYGGAESLTSKVNKPTDNSSHDFTIINGYKQDPINRQWVHDILMHERMLLAITNHADGLVRLELNHVPLIEIKTVETLLPVLPRLRFLRIRCCRLLDLSATKALMRACIDGRKKGKHIDLDFLPQIQTDVANLRNDSDFNIPLAAFLYSVLPEAYMLQMSLAKTTSDFYWAAESVGYGVDEPERGPGMNTNVWKKICAGIQDQEVLEWAARHKNKKRRTKSGREKLHACMNDKHNISKYYSQSTLLQEDQQTTATVQGPPNELMAIFFLPFQLTLVSSDQACCWGCILEQALVMDKYHGSCFEMAYMARKLLRHGLDAMITVAKQNLPKMAKSKETWEDIAFDRTRRNKFDPPSSRHW